MFSRLHRRALAIAALTALIPAAALAAPTTLIRTEGHTDFAFDTQNSTLYISGSDALQRYDVRSRQFLQPLYVGGQTAGMDISADGRYLAVANYSRTDTSNFVDIIDLADRSSQRVSFGLEFYEGGTFTTAFDGQNGLLVSSTFEGSGWVPLRRIDLATGQTVVLGSVRQSSMLAASADGSVVAVAESNISNGAWGLYQSGATSYTSTMASGWFNYEIGVSRDGSQVGIPTYGGTLLVNVDGSVTTVGEYASGQPVGVAYNPVADTVYLPWAGSSEVYAYDTRTGNRSVSYDFEEQFSHPGNWSFGGGRAKVSDNGEYLFVSTGSGIRYLSLANEVPEPHSAILLAVGLFALVKVSRKKSVRH